MIPAPGEYKVKKPKATLKAPHKLIQSANPFKMMSSGDSSKSKRISASKLKRRAKMMYALPVNPTAYVAPIGYDPTVREDPETGGLLLDPIDEVFHILVRAREYLKHSSYYKVAQWVTKEFYRIDYDWKKPIIYPDSDSVCAKAYVPDETKVMGTNTLFYVYRDRPPLDECLLSLDERQRIFDIEIKSLLS